jgi:hypothetical protein
MIRIWITFFLISSFLSAQEKWPPVVEVELRGSMTPFPAEGKWHLAYEIHITNLERKQLKLTQVEITGQPLLTSETLGPNLYHLGTSKPSDPTLLPAGKRAVLFVWVTTDTRPDKLEHRVTFENETPVTLPIKRISKRDPIEIAPPLQGANWLAANGPSNVSAHRRALLPGNGHLRCPQRYAIDFLQMGETGRTFEGNRKENESYFAYGKKLLAVASGTVVRVKDEIPENIPGLRSRAVRITPETLGGNYVVLKIAPDRYAFYAHIIPGSLQVKVGDQVKAGQTLGLLGNSGNSTEPHLHLHIMDSPDPIASDGLPFLIDRYQDQGDLADFDSAWDSKGILRKKELPLQNRILRFNLDPY